MLQLLNSLDENFEGYGPKYYFQYIKLKFLTEITLQSKYTSIYSKIPLNTWRKIVIDTSQ